MLAAIIAITATADSVYPDEDSYAADYKPPKLISSTARLRFSK